MKALNSSAAYFVRSRVGRRRLSHQSSIHQRVKVHSTITYLYILRNSLETDVLVDLNMVLSFSYFHLLE